MLSENPNSNFFPIVANNNKSIDESIQNVRLIRVMQKFLYLNSNSDSFDFLL